MQSELTTATKLLFVLTGFMAILVALIAYFALSGGPRETGEANATVAAATPADTLGPGTPGQGCARGERCPDCACQPGLLCHHLRCLGEDDVVKLPQICAEDPQLWQVVRTLAGKCASRQPSTDRVASAGACTTPDWQALALEDLKFDLLLSSFPDRIAVHFPTGQPHPRRLGWPTPAVRSHLLTQIRQFAAALRGSKQVFIIGRASPEGDPADNELLAVRRMELARELVTEVLAEGAEPGRASTPIHQFTLPTTNPINPVRYRKSYLNNPDGSPPAKNPIVAWDEANQRDLQTALAVEGDLDARGSREWQALYEAINRVVLIVPIPCLGDEYDPRAAAPGAATPPR